MNRLIEENREAICNLCRQHRVRRLDLFGSAAGPSFDPGTSDLDFLVEFEALPHGEYADAYFGLLEGLQDLLHRPVYLVVESAIRNPYFRKSIERTRTLLYAA